MIDIEQLLQLHKKEMEAVKPSEELLQKTLEKISVTNSQVERNSFVQNFYREAVNSLNIMNISKLIAPVGIAVFVLAAIVLYKSDFISTKDIKGNMPNGTQATKMAKPDGSIDTTVDALLGYSDDAVAANADNESADASVIDAEVSGAYSEQYEINGL